MSSRVPRVAPAARVRSARLARVARFGRAARVRSARFARVARRSRVRSLGRLARAVWIAVPTAAIATGCATVRSGGAPPSAELDRVAIARCAYDGIRAFTIEDLRALSGEYRLSMTVDGEPVRTSGSLELHAPAGERSNPASPLLIGAAIIDLGPLGARVPGDLASRDASAPGAGLYGFAEGAATAAVVRLGSEANRLDRQRFDGAHTTLRIQALGSGRFGGTWVGESGTERVGGEFCATPESAPR